MTKMYMYIQYTRNTTGWCQRGTKHDCQSSINCGWYPTIENRDMTDTAVMGRRTCQGLSIGLLYISDLVNYLLLKW